MGLGNEERPQSRAMSRVGASVGGLSRRRGELHLRALRECPFFSDETAEAPLPGRCAGGGLIASSQFGKRTTESKCSGQRCTGTNAFPITTDTLAGPPQSRIRSFEGRFRYPHDRRLALPAIELRGPLGPAGHKRATFANLVMERRVPVAPGGEHSADSEHCLRQCTEPLWRHLIPRVLTYNS